MAYESPKKLGNQQSSWLLAGQEVCVFCGQVYLLQMELRCVECDHAICPLCVLEMQGRTEVWCPGCRPSQKSGD